MENTSPQLISSNKGSKTTDNIQINNSYLPNIYKQYISNEDYIKLFYNSKNSGLNKNFSLNVIYNKRKSKSSK